MKNKNVILAVVALVVVAVIAVVVIKKKGGGGSAGDNFSYTLGHEYAMNIKKQQVTVDIPEFLKGAEDVLRDKKPRLNEEEMRQALIDYQKKFDEERVKKAQENDKKGQAFLAEYDKQSGVKSTSSGMRYKVIKEGNGPKPKPDDTVSVHYTGKLIDGTEFDSSKSSTNPIDINLKTVIPGWIEALSMMPVGSKWEIALPAKMAYGDQVHPKIPSGSTLVFEIELFGIKKK
jgi:FKBP-type peptidyl-prolyl cis-trans isomerase FkpA